MLTSVMARLSPKIVEGDNGCWAWTGATTSRSKPYGQCKYKGRNVLVHTLLYELLKKPIPEGHEIDHLCRNALCCNQAHLEPVTRRENIRRRLDYHKAFCKHGHAMTPENIYTNPSGRKKGARNCKVCRDKRCHQFWLRYGRRKH